MKKSLLFLFICVFVTNSFANDIAANVTNPVCDNETLSKYNGTVNVEINWEPNVIDLRWYDGNTQLTPSNPASNSCTYDGAMYIPEPPTKTGYTFQGWTVQPQMDFSTIDKSNPTGEAITWTRVSMKWCQSYYTDYITDGKYDAICDSDSIYSDLQPYEWKIKLNNGNLYGMWKCSATSSNNINKSGEINTPINEAGKYCWCKVTGYKANNTNVINVPSNILSWVYIQSSNYTDVYTCEWDCGIRCNIHFLAYPSIKNALFTPANN